MYDYPLYCHQPYAFDHPLPAESCVLAVGPDSGHQPDRELHRQLSSPGISCYGHSPRRDNPQSHAFPRSEG